MKQIFHHYSQWEDYQNGMFRSVNAVEGHQLILKAYQLLSNQDVCYQAMTRVVNEWPNASQQNLTNTNQNRRSWLGQAACCIEFAVPETLTRMAWNEMSQIQQELANAMADLVIIKFEQLYAENIPK